MSVQPLNEGGAAETVAAGRTVLMSNDGDQKPGDRTRLNEIGVGGDVFRLHFAPDRARVLRVLPGGTNGVVAQHLWICVRLKRVGTEEVGGELVTLIIEQRRLGCEEGKPDA